MNHLSTPSTSETDPPESANAAMHPRSVLPNNPRHLPPCGFYDPAEAANVLGLTAATVRKLLRDGKLLGFQCGVRRWRIPHESIDCWNKQIVKGETI